MILNNAGHMVAHWYNESGNKYPDKKYHEMIIMPNHFHFIIENVPIPDNNVKPVLRGRPEYGADNQILNATIGDAIGWFKTMTTNEYIRGVNKYNWERFDKKLWQRNYWEHIIRNEEDYNRIANYINNNPENWDRDTLKPNNNVT